MQCSGSPGLETGRTDLYSLRLEKLTLVLCQIVENFVRWILGIRTRVDIDSSAVVHDFTADKGLSIDRYYLHCIAPAWDDDIICF